MHLMPRPVGLAQIQNQAWLDVMASQDRQRVVVEINPESDESCRGCQLLKGLNTLQCLAGFLPRLEWPKTVRPQACLDAVESVRLSKLFLTWGEAPSAQETD